MRFESWDCVLCVEHLRVGLKSLHLKIAYGNGRMSLSLGGTFGTDGALFNSER